MAIAVKTLVSEILSKMTLSEAIKTIESYEETSREAITEELWNQYHAKCAQGG